MFFSMKNQKALACGLFLGMTLAVCPLAPQPKAEAAIAVWNEKNIEQAIQTAIKTAAILDTEQKELLLQIANQRKVDIYALATIEKKYADKEKQRGVLWNDTISILAPDSVGSLFNKDGSVNDAAMAEKVLKSRIGDLRNVLNGNITVVDAYKNEKNRMKTVDDTYKAAALNQLKEKERMKDNAKKSQEISAMANNSTSTLEVQQLQVQQLATMNDSLDAIGAIFSAQGLSEMTRHRSRMEKEAEKLMLQQKAKERAEAQLKDMDAKTGQ